MQEKLSRDITLLHCPLTEELASLVNTIHAEASSEIDRGKSPTRTQM